MREFYERLGKYRRLVPSKSHRHEEVLSCGKEPGDFRDMDIPTSPVFDLARDIFVRLATIDDSINFELMANCAFDAAEAFMRVAVERGAVAPGKEQP